jgi:hypothetical protein
MKNVDGKLFLQVLSYKLLTEQSLSDVNLRRLLYYCINVPFGLQARMLSYRAMDNIGSAHGRPFFTDISGSFFLLIMFIN